LEKDLSVQDMADVIAYLSGFAAPPKSFAGNTPSTIRADNAGVIVLSAASARIYGDTLIFEPQYGNLGYWGSTNDLASWTIDVPTPGKYQVVVEYACHPDMAGNHFRLEAIGDALSGTVAATVNWDDYRELDLGELSLQAGEQSVHFRAAGALPPGRFLIDLRAIKLVPSR
jgi:hypothetical protein